MRKKSSYSSAWEGKKRGVEGGEEFASTEQTVYISVDVQSIALKTTKQSVEACPEPRGRREKST